jgi:hypothetical protein
MNAPQPLAGNRIHYMTSEEAADFPRLSPRTLEKQRSFGTGPRYHKFGRRVRYALADLEAWAEARAFGMTADPDYPTLR